MASIASSSSEPAEMRPQAGPLPRKRGEIGYRESLHSAEDRGTTRGRSVVLTDREPTPALSAAESPDEASTPPPPTIPSVTTDDVSSVRKRSKRAAFLSWLDPRRALNGIKYGGVPLTTILRLLFQLVLLGGTLAAWIVIAVHMGKNSSSSSAANADSMGGMVPSIGSAGIFAHVTFGIATLGQLLFLERCIFYMRAQRYMHMHPDAALPTAVHGRSASGPGIGIGMSFAPWNRPSLPSYAAALAQSGVGTGDVEDNVIAIPPPPAYGNTRGSTLLLAGFLRNSLHGTADRLSTAERGQHDQHCDEEWEEGSDAERALRLAETLARLDNSYAASIH